MRLLWFRATGRHERQGRRVVPARRDDSLTALVAEHERRLNAQDEAWTAWREAEGRITAKQARLRIIKGGGG